VTAELCLVEDPQQRRHGAVDAAGPGFEGGSPRLVDGDAEPCRAGDPADDVRRRGCRPVSVVRQRELSHRFAELAQPGRVGLRDPVARCYEPLLSQPRPGPLGGPDAIPLAREVVVVGVDEALEQLEPTRRLGPPTGLDLLADPSLVVVVHHGLTSR
jgi:hypothetical protein